MLTIEQDMNDSRAEGGVVPLADDDHEDAYGMNENGGALPEDEDPDELD